MSKADDDLIAWEKNLFRSIKNNTEGVSFNTNSIEVLTKIVIAPIERIDDLEMEIQNKADEE